MSAVHTNGEGPAIDTGELLRSVSMHEYPAGGLQGDHFSLSLSEGVSRQGDNPELLVADVYQEVSKGVVSIPRPASPSEERAHEDHSHAPQLETMGSGFVIDAAEGIVVTNWHVAEATEDVSVNVCGQNVKASVIGVDPYSDLAFLKLKEIPEGLTALTLGDTKSLRVGDPVMTIGSPFGLDGSIGTGIISGPPRKLASEGGYPLSGLIQHSAMINPGNSGGVLVDYEGRVIGMNTAIPTTSGGFQGIGFAVAAQEITEAWEELQSSGLITRQYCGMHFAKTDYGVALASVDSGSPADRLGIEAEQYERRKLFSRSRELDLERCVYLTHINEKPIASTDDIFAALEANQGDAIEFTLKKTAHGDPYTVSMVPDKQPVADMLKLREVKSRLRTPQSNCSHLYLAEAKDRLEPDELQVLVAAYSMVALVDRKGITVHVNPAEAPATLLGKGRNLKWLTGELRSAGFTADPDDDLTFRHRADPYEAERILGDLGRIAHGVSAEEMASRMSKLPPGLLDALREKLGPGLGGGMLIME